jgi:hypothetical protein
MSEVEEMNGAELAIYHLEQATEHYVGNRPQIQVDLLYSIAYSLIYLTEMLEETKE